MDIIRDEETGKIYKGKSLEKIGLVFDGKTPLFDKNVSPFDDKRLQNYQYSDEKVSFRIFIVFYKINLPVFIKNTSSGETFEFYIKYKNGEWVTGYESNKQIGKDFVLFTGKTKNRVLREINNYLKY